MQPVLSLGASSIGEADMIRLRHTVKLAAPRLPFGIEWREGANADSADVMFIDVDTIYGHVDWLRAQSGGRALIALTSRASGAHDNEFNRDADDAALVTVLMEFAPLASGRAEAVSPPASTPHSPAPPRAVSLGPTTELPAIKDSGRDTGLAPTRELPALAADSAARMALNSAQSAAAAGAQAEAPAQAIETPPPPPRNAMSLLDWLRDRDGVEGLQALALEDGERLIVDRARSVFFGPITLKSLLPLAQRPITRKEWSPVDATAAANLGEAQPIGRLRLLAGLGANSGALGSDLDASLPFRLPKWPQIEREFPKHMRIATALMKGPVTIDELVSQLSLPYGEVADFLNGFVAAGFVEQVHPPVVEPAPPPPAGGDGLMGRLRSLGRNKP